MSFIEVNPLESPIAPLISVARINPSEPSRAMVKVIDAPLLLLGDATPSLSMVGIFAQCMFRQGAMATFMYPKPEVEKNKNFLNVIIYDIGL